jgi:hypothetical protein
VIFLFFCASKRLRLRSLGALLCTITISWLTAYGLSEIDHDPRSIFSALSGLMELLVVPFVANSSTSFFFAAGCLTKVRLVTRLQATTPIGCRATTPHCLCNHPPPERLKPTRPRLRRPR